MKGSTSLRRYGLLLTAPVQRYGWLAFGTMAPQMRQLEAKDAVSDVLVPLTLIFAVLSLGMAGFSLVALSSSNERLADDVHGANARAELALGGKHEEAIVSMNDDCRPLLKALLGLCLIGTLGAGAIGWPMARSLLQALGTEPGELNAVALRVAAGDLSPVVGANQFAASASQAAQRGGGVMQDVVTTMQNITSSFKKVADIITVIDGIAFQTNILALNAAVEAARAGEQTTAIGLVTDAVGQLDQVTQQNAALVEEGAATRTWCPTCISTTARSTWWPRALTWPLAEASS